MFYLRQRVMPASMREGVIQAINRASVRLSDAVIGLKFDEKEHAYSISGVPVPSVSSIVEKYSSFDAEKTARGCVKSPSSKYYGMKPEDVLAQWEENARQAADAGTEVHEFTEACYLWMIGLEEEIPPKFADRIKPDGLEARTPKEIAAARWWDTNDWERYVPVAKETRIYNPELKYAGTFDLLLYDTITSTYVIRDYKTNKDLHSWYGDWMRSAFKNILRDNDEGHYTIQQNLYGIEIMDLGLPVSDSSLLWLQEDGNFEEYKLDMRVVPLIRNTVARDQRPGGLLSL